MDKTPHFNLPLPNPSHTLATDCDNLVTALTQIDKTLKDLADTTTFATDKAEILAKIEQVKSTLNQAMLALQTSTDQKITVVNGTLANFEQAINENHLLALAGL